MSLHGREKVRYIIDSKLKIGKDYPFDLLILFNLFKNPLPWGQIFRNPITKRELEEELRLLRADEIGNIPESKRKEYVAGIQKRFDKGPRGIALGQLKREALSIERIFEDYFLARSAKIADACIEKVNKKLRYVYPVLSKSSVGEGKQTGLAFNFEVTLADFPWRKDAGFHHLYWLNLARTMTKLSPKLVHRCPECKTIFISKQRKKYDSHECRKTFLIRKAVKTGRAKANQQAYRDRKKKKAKRRRTRAK